MDLCKSEDWQIQSKDIIYLFCIKESNHPIILFLLWFIEYQDSFSTYSGK